MIKNVSKMELVNLNEKNCGQKQSNSAYTRINIKKNIEKNPVFYYSNSLYNKNVFPY